VHQPNVLHPRGQHGFNKEEQSTTRAMPCRCFPGVCCQLQGLRPLSPIRMYPPHRPDTHIPCTPPNGGAFEGMWLRNTTSYGKRDMLALDPTYTPLNSPSYMASRRQVSIARIATVGLSRQSPKCQAWNQWCYPFLINWYYHARAPLRTTIR
jgi:hypothetical protein